MATKNKLFYAEASKGYIVKVTVDTLCGGALQRGHFVIDKDGIRLRQSDQGNTILYDMVFPRKNFKNYKCTKTMCISVNLKHMQGLLRNVKKKDSIAIYIDSGIPNKFFIMIRPEGVRENIRFETNSIVYQEEKEYQIMELPDGQYKYPMVIAATDFQKLKRLTTIGKSITISIQKSNFLRFKCDAGAVFDSELGFGELRDDVDTDDEADNTGDDEGCEDEEGEESEDDEEGEESEDDEEEGSEEDENEEDEGVEVDSPDISKTPGVFEAEYYCSILNKLVKLPGLCTQMQFYAPTIAGYPLRIEVNAGQGGYTLGTIQVFIKDVNQIAYEASIMNEGDTIVTTSSTRGKNKPKKK
jgi:hypothetical protein